MSMDMVEKVARAIFDVSSLEGVTRPFERASKGSRDLHREWARAAIKAHGDTQRERRLFEALYALAKAAESLDELGGWQRWRSLRDALVEANEALAYPTKPDGHAPPGQDAP